MKKRKFSILAIAGALLMALALGACNNSSDSGSGGGGGGGGGGVTPPPGPTVKIVEDIRIKTLPKTEYILGEEFSIEGGVLELCYDDGTFGDLSFTDSKVKITAPDMTNAGVKSVNVDYDGFIAQYQITIRKQSYVVTFDLNYENAPSMDLVNVEPDGLLAKPVDPTRTDYRFEGWFTDKECTQAFDFSTTAITANLTLYAKWVQEISVSFVLYEGATPTKINVALNQKITIWDAPSVLREGYQFLGWFNGETRYDFSTPITTSISLEAKWNAIPTGTEARKVTINFNAGDQYESIEYYVANGATTFQPDDVVIEGKDFQGWYQAPQGNDPYDFNAPINADTVIYAHYVVEYYTVNFKYVANGTETIHRTKQVTPGEKVTTVSQKPNVANYLFDGKWYTSKACSTLFDFNTEIYQDYDLYTKALKKNIFEAEYTYIDDAKPGVGSSDSFNGLKLIFEDNGTAEASNGYWVSGLYYNGAFIEFVINSEKAFSDGQLEMNLSSEWADIYLAPEETTVAGQAYHAFEIAVYEASVDESGNLQTDSKGYALYDESTKKTVDYSPIALEGSITFSESMVDKRAFSHHFITDEFAMNKGYNVIRLTVRNSVPPYDGTMDAHAPMIDNIIIYTDSELTWTPREDNVADYTKINYAENKH